MFWDNARVELLGPLHVELNGASAVPTAVKPKQIMALLALNPGRVVPVPTLMEEIWGTKPPQTAVTTLQTYILKLRRKLSSAAGPEQGAYVKDLLVTRHGGYALQIRPENVDLHGFERLSAEGRRAFARGDYETASRSFDRVLRMWNGPALVDVASGPFLSIEAMRLEESKLSCLGLRMESDLRMGRHAERTAELLDLAARYPLDEQWHFQAMLALYRSGRQARALDVYNRLRARLVEELGVEPSPRLRHLHQSILKVSPELDGPMAIGWHSPGYELHAA